MSDGKILGDTHESTINAQVGAVEKTRAGGISRRSLLTAAAGAVAWSNLTIINKIGRAHV